MLLCQQSDCCHKNDDISKIDFTVNGALLFFFQCVYRGEDHHCLSVCFNADAIFLHLPRCISHMLTNEKRESNVPGYRFSTHQRWKSFVTGNQSRLKQMKHQRAQMCLRNSLDSHELQKRLNFLYSSYFLLFSTSFRKLFQVLSSVQAQIWVSLRH